MLKQKNMAYFVYVLRSRKDGKRYIGMTNDVARRLLQHNAGKVVSTKSRRPFVIEKIEEFLNIISARNRERYFKTAAGRRFLKEVDSCAGGGMADTDV